MEKRKREKNENGHPKKGRREQLAVDRIVEKIRKKLNERIKREKANLPGDQSLVLSKIAYDLARSGTEDQIDEIDKVASYLISPLNPEMIIPLSKANRIQQAYHFSESAFLLSLSGIKNPEVYEIIIDNVFRLLSQLPYDATDDLKQIVDSFELLALSGLRSSPRHQNRNFDMNLFLEILQTILRNNSDSVSRRPHLRTLRNILEDLTSSSSDQEHFGYWLQSSSSGPLLALWLHSTKQKKIRYLIDDTVATPPGTRKAKLTINTNSDAKTSDGKKRSRVIWSGDSPLGFADMSLPLVIDVGCGFGVSLLGIATAAATAAASVMTGQSQQNSFPHSNSSFSSSLIGNWNCLGCDLSSHCVRYAQSISARWELSSRCRFCVAPAEEFVEWVRDYYPGPVVWVLLQFPTPYVLRTKAEESNRNIQLPVLSCGEVLGSSERSSEGQGGNDGDEGGFMVTNKLIEIILSLMIKSREQVNHLTVTPTPPSPCLYVQSNVEDVAVTMKKKIESHCLSSSTHLSLRHLTVQENDTSVEVRGNEVSDEINEIELVEEQRTKRQELWEGLGGERIEFGCEGWLRNSPFPVHCRTETEASYGIIKKPVFRIGWEVVEG
jgi:hypothetical protein